MYLVTAEEMRAFDAAAIEEYGIPGVVLMENAGRTTFHILKTHLGGDVRDLKVSVVAGPGNNGGDGYVIARYLINHGAEVQTFLLSPREKIKGDALVNLHVLERMSSHVYEVTDEESFKQAVRQWRQSQVVVDAILGTGLDSEVRSPYREAIVEINRVNGLRLAVDLPVRSRRRHGPYPRLRGSGGFDRHIRLQEVGNGPVSGSGMLRQGGGRRHLHSPPCNREKPSQSLALRQT